MPRAGQVKPPAPQRLGDRVAIGALTSVFPPDLVDQVIEQTGRAEQRRRLLPARMVLRSKHPVGVEQGVWAHLLVHYAIRRLMHQAALDEGVDPDRLSFVGTLRIVRRHLASHAAFSP